MPMPDIVHSSLWVGQVEVGVLVLREQLEEQGLKASEVDRQVDAHRAKLVAEVDAALAKASSPRAGRSSR